MLIETFNSFTAEMLSDTIQRQGRMASVLDVFGVASPKNGHAVSLRDALCSIWTKEKSCQVDDILSSLRQVLFHNLGIP